MWIGAGAPHNFWEIGAKATCTNPEKGATVRTAKNQGWKRRLHRSVGRDTGGCPAGARQPEERIRPNRTAEIPKTDSTCKGGNEDASKKEFARAAAVLMHGGRNTAGDSVCCGAICAGKSPLVGIWKPGNVG